MSANILFSELFTYSVDNPEEKLPVSQLTQSDCHIHGHLQVVIDNRVMPHMGFFGPHDVCFNTWLEEFAKVLGSLGPSATAIYVFDEGEQGQPGFEFKRSDETLSVSVIASAISDGSADASFQSVCCQWAEFESEVELFFMQFHQALIAAAPGPGHLWWKQHAKHVA